MQESSKGEQATRAERKQLTLRDPGEMVVATRQRVKNTRRIIAQSRELLGKAREALNSTKSLRVVLEKNRKS